LSQVPVRANSPSALTTVLRMGILLALVGSGCSAIEGVVAQGASFGGAAADAHCDRRYPLPGGQASPFCQEVQATLAASQFTDDCRDHLLATPGPGLCPTVGIIAGCKLDEQQQDNSTVRDWYYDVSAIIAEAGASDGPDGGPTFVPPLPHTVSDVAAICADRTRYEDGAELVLP
jgi:hypothetical protein